jgi:hypothetical protein
MNYAGLFDFNGTHKSYKVFMLSYAHNLATDWLYVLSPIIYRYINPVFSKYFKFVIKRRSEDLAFQRNVIINKNNVSLVIDVGAHHGETIREIRANGYTKKIISVEPTPQSFEILSRYNDKKLSVFNIGFGDIPGFFSFTNLKIL